MRKVKRIRKIQARVKAGGGNYVALVGLGGGAVEVLLEDTPEKTAGLALGLLQDLHTLKRLQRQGISQETDSYIR